MANTDKPNGFTPAYNLYGGTINATRLELASAYDTLICSGDLVKLNSGRVEQAGATDTPAGVFYGVQYTATTGAAIWSNQWTADTATLGSANAIAYVYTDPAIVYEAQFTGTPTIAAVGAKHTLSTTAGSTLNGRSKEGVTTTTSSGIALCIGFVQSPSNSIGQYARAFFTFPTSVFAV
jgi:hypothetical protein